MLVLNPTAGETDCTVQSEGAPRSDPSQEADGGPFSPLLASLPTVLPTGVSGREPLGREEIWSAAFGL